MNPYQFASALFLRFITWLTSFFHQRVPYLRRRQIIRDALTASLDISQRLSSWSGQDPRSRPFSMQFHENWGHPDCEVMKWYSKIPSRSTIFYSIQHRRSTKGPFYHEFLQIQLTDGSVCIVERMGEGIQSGAISCTGCTSHDIIQWFTADEYSTWSLDPKHKPSEVIVEIKFPRAFDLLDVLAICYATKHHARATNYTLQRFNCYFLCCTILSILARCISPWEHYITTSDWNDMIEETLEDLRHSDSSNLLIRHPLGSMEFPMRSSPEIVTNQSDQRTHMQHSEAPDPTTNNPATNQVVPKNAEIAPSPSQDEKAIDPLHNTKKYLAIGICSLLGSDGLPVVDFLFDSLRSELNTGANDNLNEKLARCLWYDRLDQALSNAIELLLMKLTRPVRDGSFEGCQRMSDLLGPENGSIFPRSGDLGSIENDVRNGFFRAFTGILDHHINISQARYELRSFEGEYPFWKRCLTWIGAVLIMILAYPILIAQLKFVALGMAREDPATFTDNRWQDALDWNTQLTNGWAEALSPILASLLDTEPPNTTGALAFLNSALPGNIWRSCFSDCVLNKMSESIRKTIRSKEGRISVRLGLGDAEQGAHSWTVDELQQHILARVRLHAKRVDDFQLARAFVVESGMATAITDVWVGFSACRS
ncbi:hypothetical protein RHS04_01172 [Rhizoctonia solani]|uniref:Uncharacterized protein n=1 Tax=Rhizoctonia solani TaxID=456999 RepID=A0A8H7HDB4_9AGAM|nr:hypothetical protein RHS04_01172 [Rhizoctonia solani]